MKNFPWLQLNTVILTFFSKKRLNKRWKWVQTPPPPVMENSRSCRIFFEVITFFLSEKKVIKI